MSTLEVLKLSEVSKIFSDELGIKKKVLENVSFEITNSTSRFTSVLAPFGGGKTTLFKIIAGIETPTTGDVILNGEKYLRPNGKIVLIPEKPATLPWLNVLKNVELACRLENCGKNKGSYEINDLISLVGLSGYENHFPHNDSIGFRFRISLARALLFNPFVLLLDDCFKKMEAATREEMYHLLEFIAGKIDTYFLLATTNILEAVRLSRKVFLMSKEPGKLLKEINISESSPGKYQSMEIPEFIKLIDDAYRTKKYPGSINFSI